MIIAPKMGKRKKYQGRGTLARWRKYRQKGASASLLPGWQRRAWVWSTGSVSVSYCVETGKTPQSLPGSVERCKCWLIDCPQASQTVTALGDGSLPLWSPRQTHPQQRPVSAISQNCHSTRRSEEGSSTRRSSGPRLSHLSPQCQQWTWGQEGSVLIDPNPCSSLSS